MTDPAQPVVIVEAAAQLATTLELLTELDAHVSQLARDTESTSQARSLGQLIEAIDVAGDMLFNVLNTASAHLGCTASRRAIARSHAKASGLEVVN